MKKVNKSYLNIIPSERIEPRIFFIRNQKVMIDRDLAELYDVETKYLNRQVKRNLERFPPEFMFQLIKKEKDELVTNCHRLKNLKHSSALPYAFNEHGVAMLSGVLKSRIAVKISIHIVKAFIRLRRVIATHEKLAQKFKELEKRVGRHDQEIAAIVDMIKKLIEGPPKPKTKIGFHPDE